MYQEFLNEASFLFLLPRRNSEALYVPSSPWQTSVRVAPPTINWGLAHNSWKDTISKFASPSLVWKVPFSCSLFQYSKTTKHFQHFFKNISFLLCLINRIPGQYFLIKLRSACIFFEANPDALLGTISDTTENFCCCGDRGENSPQRLHLTLSRWDFGSSNTNEFVTVAAACATGAVLSFQCQQRGGCSPTLTLLPGRPTTQMLLLATTPLSSWPFGASQVGYGNDCHSYPNPELSNNSWPILGSYYCLSRDKSLFCFSENFPWASGWQQGVVYGKPNLASRVEDSLGSHWLSSRAVVVSSEQPVER